MAKFTLFPGKTSQYTSKKGTVYTVMNDGGKIVCFSQGKKRKPTKEILSKFAVSGGIFTVYSDGGCKVNPGGNGGYGAVVIDGEGNITQLSEGYIASTNNRMELMGAIAGLSAIPRGATVEFYSDSQYVINTMKGSYSRNKNLDLWAKLDEAVKGKRIKYKWVRGHSENKFNEICDKLATSAMNKDDLLKDEGFTGEAKTQKYSAMTIDIQADDKRPEIGNVSNVCRNGIIEFYKKSDHRFKDYIILRTGGIDEYSNMSEAELLDICKADTNTIKNYLKGKDVITALRWNCRGLSLKDSIRKVYVDKEAFERNTH